MEETNSPTSQETGKAVLGPVMWMEVLRLVIAPRLAEIVRERGDGIENRQQLHRTFCDLHGVKPSYSTFSGWCEDLGITFRKRIEVSIPGWREMPRPSPEFVGPMPAGPTSPSRPQQAEAGPEEPVQWDGPPVREMPIEAFNDGMPDILPGGFRAPSFFGSSDFAN